MYARSREGTLSAAAQVDSHPAKEISAAGVFVCRLQAAHFRNYPFLRLELPTDCPQIVLTGKNGVGKTNLLEAVSFLVPGKGLRQAKFADILPKENEQATAWGVTATLHRGGDEEIEVGTDYEKIDGKNSERRRVRINGASGLAQTELGRVCSAVWLTPSMDRLFSGEPAGRRRFLDRLAQAFFENHASACAAYSQALKQWSALMRDGEKDERWLSALEKTLGKYGAKVASVRRKTVAILQAALEKEDTTAFPRPMLSLIGGWEEEQASVSEEEAGAFIQNRFVQARETYAQTGSAGGIHTVDLVALHQEKNMPAAACSTGEQKALLISILLAHIKAQASAKGVFPLVLFDEAAAHLDFTRREALMSKISVLKTQVWLTGTDSRPFESLKETAHFIAVDELLRNVPDWAAAS